MFKNSNNRADLRYILQCTCPIRHILWIIQFERNLQICRSSRTKLGVAVNSSIPSSIACISLCVWSENLRIRKHAGSRRILPSSTKINWRISGDMIYRVFESFEKFIARNRVVGFAQKNFWDRRLALAVEGMPLLIEETTLGDPSQIRVIT